MNERPIVTVVRGCDVIATESNVNDLVNTHGAGSVMVDGVPFNQLSEDDQATARAMPWRDLPSIEAPDPHAEKQAFVEAIAVAASAPAYEPVPAVEPVNNDALLAQHIASAQAAAAAKESENASADASVAASTQPE